MQLTKPLPQIVAPAAWRGMCEHWHRVAIAQGVPAAVADLGRRLLAFDHAAPPHLWEECGWTDVGAGILSLAIDAPDVARRGWTYLVEGNFELGFVSAAGLWQPFRQIDPASLRERVEDLVAYVNGFLDVSLPESAAADRREVLIRYVAERSYWMTEARGSTGLSAMIGELLMQALDDPDGRSLADARQRIRETITTGADWEGGPRSLEEI